jgi:hypothetical protein
MIRRFVTSALLVVIACAQRAPTPVDERAVVEARSREVLAALSAHDLARVATFVHPSDGVRFSPYAHVDSTGRVFHRAQVARLWTDSTKYEWGFADGSGDPIVLSYPEYHRRFVYNHDFVRAPRTAYTAAPIQSGNSPSNLAAMYPGSKRVEFHFPGFDAKYNGMDWSSLWLVFQRADEEWFLVGVVNGRWTI